jgi:hypothetical protein
MARTTAYTYFDSPCRATMKLVEGAWTDDDTKKAGGYFASPLNKDMFVKLHATLDWTVQKATASTDIILGKLISDPEGEHVANSRLGTIQLNGNYIMEVEMATTSAVLSAGDSVILTASGGGLGEGLWVVNAPAGTKTFNGTIALVSMATASYGSGITVPILFGATKVGGY